MARQVIINAAEFEFLMEGAERTLPDTCYIQRFTAGTADAFGHVARTWVEDTLSTACGVQATTTSEEGDQAEISVGSYRLRLPYDESLTSRDRIRITSIKGRSMSILTSIIGEPVQGNLHLIANVQEVADV